MGELYPIVAKMAVWPDFRAKNQDIIMIKLNLVRFGKIKP